MAPPFSTRAVRLAKRWGDPVIAIANAELLYPETALAIAVLETGGFRSKRMMKSHNWFGFRRDGRGYQLRVKRGYGVYASAEMMLKDYADWESEIIIRYSLNSETAFRNWICSHYAEDPAYGQKLTATLKLIGQTWN